MTDPTDEGGDPACWAHPVEEDAVSVADLAPLLEAAGDGVHWTLVPDGDLNANLVRLEPGHAIDEHANDEVDVLLVVLAGAGHVVVDDRSAPVAALVLAHVPKGASRSIHAGPEGLAYLTVHRRRGGVPITRR